jgi:hypothetical protein
MPRKFGSDAFNFGFAVPRLPAGLERLSDVLSGRMQGGAEDF